MPGYPPLRIRTNATYQHLMLRIISIGVFLKSHFLVYVIRLPLTNNLLYNWYHVLPFQREQNLNLHSRKDSIVIY